MDEQNNLFAASAFVRSERILCTPSNFAGTNLLYLQEIGRLKALAPHTNRREKLKSCLCFVVLEGSGTLEYDGAAYTLKAGDVAFIDCRRPYSHSTDARDLWTLQWCHFFGASAQAIYAKYRERGGEPAFRPKSMEPYRKLLDELYEIAAANDFVRDMRINERLGTLMTLLMEESWHPEKRHAEKTKKQDIKQIKAYIDERYAERVTLESIAEKFYISKHYLARLFKEQYGVTLTSYIQQVRITHAKMMLRFTDKKVEAIGMECGFGELTYFSRIFKKIEGISPSEYRSLW